MRSECCSSGLEWENKIYRVSEYPWSDLALLEWHKISDVRYWVGKGAHSENQLNLFENWFIGLKNSQGVVQLDLNVYIKLVWSLNSQDVI